jgi:N-acetylglucosamine-6-phosphate deacetylase
MRIFAQNSFIGGKFQPATISVMGDSITEIKLGPAAEKDKFDFHFDKGFLIPGLIDIQLNGVSGIDFSTGEQDELESSLKALPQTGTTSLCPTIISSSVEQIKNQLNLFAELERTSAAARNLGVHLEGPVISRDKKGAHSEDAIINGHEFLDSKIDLALVKILTLAPEVLGAEELIRAAKEKNSIVSMGHTNATWNEALASKKAGASMVTHLFNAMRQIHQREPGIIVKALLDDDISFGLIVDGEHVDYALVDLAFRLAGDRAIVVSDASAALLSKPGQTVKLGGTQLIVSTDGMAKRADGTIASAGISHLQAIEKAVASNLNREQLIRAATLTPANLLGESRLGRLEVGAYADLVHYLVDESPLVDLVLISGEECQL